MRVGKLAESLSEEEKIIDAVRPLEDVKVNLTTGVLGFRHTKQGEYEAGFQTAARMFALMEEKEYFKKNLAGPGGGGGGGAGFGNGNSRYNNNNRSPFYQQNNFNNQNLGLEIVMSQFGKGREAFLNALNGAEGNKIRRHVTRVTDNTKIKFGGVRPPRARRV